MSTYGNFLCEALHFETEHAAWRQGPPGDEGSAGEVGEEGPSGEARRGQYEPGSKLPKRGCL